MTLFLLLFHFVVLAQAIGDYRSNGAVTFTSNTNWQKWDGSSWVTATLAPTLVSSTNIITVLSSNIASVSGTVTLSANISISGTINMANNSYLTIGSNSDWSDFTINSGGSFNMPGGSGLATLVVYGNYYNYGTTDFWKSIAVITGDLLSPSSSALQNQGNVIVGGNIIGDFNLTGGTGGSQIYAVNPNATVTINPTSIDGNVTPGTQPTGESSSLQNLVNSVIYGSSSCTSFTITDPASNISACVGSDVMGSVSSTGTLPLYQWQVNSGSSGWNDILLQTSSTLSLTSVTADMAGNKYRAKVTVGGCTKNSNYVTLSINTSSVAPTSITGTTTICNGNSTTLTLSGGTAGTGATAKWYSVSCGGTLVGTGNSVTVSPTTNTNYYVRYEGTCNTTTCASTTVTVNALPNNVINGFSATTICAGGSPQLTFNAEASSFSVPYSITYRNDVTLLQYIIAIPSSSAYSFTPADNPTSNTGYTLVSISNASCTATTGFIDSGANLIVRPMPTATISGTTSVCVGDSSPNITFTNPQTVAITVTYTINGGTNQTINIAASSSLNIAVATTAAGAFVYNLVSAVYQSTPNCSNVLSGSATVTVNPNLPASVSVSASPSGAICSGASVTFTATSTNGGTTPTYQWYNGATLISGQTASTYTSTTLANSDTIKVVMTSNATPCLTGSPAASNSITTTVLAPPSAPVVGAITHPSCTTSKGSVVLSGLPSGTWDLYQDSTGLPIISGGTGSSIVISELVSGTHYFNVDNGSCLSPKSVDVVVNTSPATKTWNGTAWSPDPSIAPTIENKVVFNGNYSSSSNLEACSCYVNNAVVIFNSGHTLKAVNEVDVASNGTLTFENNASLVQVNDLAVNSGNIIYKRTTTLIFNTDYVYWSSPVAGFTLGGIQTGTLYYSFNASGNSWVGASASTGMTAGAGYIVRGGGTGLTTGSTFVKTATFTGEPNNGEVFASIGGANTSNLIGNPYPSAIDADAFIIKNMAVLEGTLYFWTHNTAIRLASELNAGTAGSGIYAYTSDDYTIYNLTGGTVAVSGGTSHNGSIAAGQGFMAKGYSVGTAVFDNSMRLGSGGAVLDNTQFFKQTRASKTVAKVEKSRIWLNLANTQGAFKQILVGYIAGATNAYDRAYDGVNYNGNKYVNFYSINNTTNLTVQGRALPFDITDEVPLGYSSTIVGEFSISIDKTDGLFISQDVFLEDKLLNVIHDLKQTAYVFSSDKGQFNERFVLRYKEKEVDTVNFSTASGKVLVSNKNKQVKVSSLTNDLIDKVFVYDVAGRMLYKKENVNSSEFSLINIISNNQMLLVKSVLQNGQVVISKIIY